MKIRDNTILVWAVLINLIAYSLVVFRPETPSMRTQLIILICTDVLSVVTASFKKRWSVGVVCAAFAALFLSDLLLWKI